MTQANLTVLFFSCYKSLDICVSRGQIPIVENEIKKETGEVKADDEVSVAPAQKLVTEMGTYVTQSALSSSRPSKKEEDRYKLLLSFWRGVLSYACNIQLIVWSLVISTHPVHSVHTDFAVADLHSEAS